MKCLSNIFARLSLSQGKIFIVLFIFLSFLPITQFFDEIDRDIIASRGDYIFILDIERSFFENLFVYSPILSMEITTPISLSLYSPFYIYLYFMSYIGIKPILAELLFITIIYFVGFISMYKYLLYVINEKMKLTSSRNNFVAFCGSILYNFSPFFFFYYGGGHYLFLIYTALFPLFLKYFDLFLISSKYDLKNTLYIYLIFIFSSLPYGNLGIIFVHFITILLYVFLFLLLYKPSIYKTFFKTFIVLCLFVLANSWWLIPTLITLNNVSELNEQSKNTIGAAIESATQNSTIADIFIGVPDLPILILSPYLDRFLYPSINVVYIGLVILAFVLFIRINTIKHKYAILLLFLLLAALYVVKGPNPPFSELFMFLYDNVLGFQVFRRPASKIYWLFLFALVVLSMLSVAYFYTKVHLRKLHIFITGFLIISIIIFSIIAINVKGLQTYKIPSVYFDAGNLLEQENASKILLLPDLGGYPVPRYNQNMNYFTGVDFINQIWKYPKYTPDKSNWTLNTPQRKKINELALNIKNKKSICILTKELNISHIILRYDLNEEFYEISELNKLQNALMVNADILRVKDYYSHGIKYFAVFLLKNKCRSNLVFNTVDQANGFLTQASPVLYKLRLNSINKEQNINFLKAYDKNWVIYLNKEKESLSCFDRNKEFSKFGNIIFCRNNLAMPTINEIGFFWRDNYFEDTHKSVYGYANSWKINPEIIRNDLGSEYYGVNKDGSINVNMTIYYKPQLYFYFGLLMSVFVFVILISFFCINKKFKIYKPK